MELNKCKVNEFYHFVSDKKSYYAIVREIQKESLITYCFSDKNDFESKLEASNLLIDVFNINGRFNFKEYRAIKQTRIRRNTYINKAKFFYPNLEAKMKKNSEEYEWNLKDKVIPLDALPTSGWCINPTDEFLKYLCLRFRGHETIGKNGLAWNNSSFWSIDAHSNKKLYDKEQLSKFRAHKLDFDFKDNYTIACTVFNSFVLGERVKVIHVGSNKDYNLTCNSLDNKDNDGQKVAFHQLKLMPKIKESAKYNKHDTLTVVSSSGHNFAKYELVRVISIREYNNKYIYKCETLNNTQQYQDIAENELSPTSNSGIESFNVRRPDPTYSVGQKVIIDSCTNIVFIGLCAEIDSINGSMDYYIYCLKFIHKFKQHKMFFNEEDIKAYKPRHNFHDDRSNINSSIQARHGSLFRNTEPLIDYNRVSIIKETPDNDLDVLAKPKPEPKPDKDLVIDRVPKKILYKGVSYKIKTELVELETQIIDRTIKIINKNR